MAQAGGERDDWLEGLEFSFSGRFLSMTHKHATELVEKRGGRVADVLGESTEYLVIGRHHWPLQGDGRITRKITQANAMREEARGPAILMEEEFLERLGLKDHESTFGSLFTLAQLARILDVPKRRIRIWMRHGLIQPVQTVHRLHFFDFRQVAGARTLIELLRSGVSMGRIRQSFSELAGWLPDIDLPLSQLAILEGNGHLLVRLQGGELAETSGQLHFSFADPGFEASGFVDDSDSNEGVVALERSEEGSRAESSLWEPPGVQRTIALPTTSRTADDWFESALDFEDCGDFESAVSAYRQALLLGESRPEACFNLANALYALDRREQAMERYYQAVELDREYVEAWNNLANVLTEMEEWQEAIRAYRTAIEIAPSYADAHYNLAETLDQIGMPNDADRHYQAYLSLDPQSSWAEIVRQRLMDVR